MKLALKMPSVSDVYSRRSISPLKKCVCGCVSTQRTTQTPLCIEGDQGHQHVRWAPADNVPATLVWHCSHISSLLQCHGDMVRMLRIRRNSTAGIRSLQMSWLIRRSTIKIIELRLPVRGDAGSGMGGRPEGGTYNPFSLYSSTLSDISTSCTPASSWSHTAGRISASLSASDSRI